MPTLIKLACPNCGFNLAEENLHSNILQCPRCNSYTYYESGMYNVNVFFGLLRSHTYQLDGLRKTIIDRYVAQGSLKAIRNIKYLHAERVLVPVREIDSDGEPKAVPLLEQSQDVADENADVRQLLQGVSNLDRVFSMQHLQPLRLSAVRDEIDRSGYITHTTILPVGRTKRSIDMAYNLPPKSLLRILYVPAYRLSFNDNGQKLLCFANSKLTGLPLTGRGGKISGLGLLSVPVAFFISIPLTVILDIIGLITGIIKVESSSFILTAIFYVVGLVVISIILLLLLTSVLSVVIYLCSKLSVSLNVFRSFKRWLIRRRLSKKFRLNERI